MEKGFIMSKELEALEIIEEYVEELVDVLNENTAGTWSTKEREFNILKQALTPPTQEEVCKGRGKGMSKEIQALELLVTQGLISAGYDFTKETKEYKIIKQALKRNEPIKVFGGCCGNCNYLTHAFVDNPNYCSKCGRKLDWSDEL